MRFLQHRPHFTLVVFALGLSTLVFLFFYPAGSANIDEQEYLRNAGLILTGGLQQDCDPQLPAQFTANGYCVSKYNIGTSLFLIPAALTRPQFAYLVSFAMSAAGALAFVSILKLLRIPRHFALLYVLYPPFIYYSRTLMSETYSATLVTLSILLFLYSNTPKLESGRSDASAILAGVAAALGVTVRYTNILWLGMAFSLSAILERKWRPALLTAAGAAPIVLSLLVFNNFLYGSLLRSGYYFSGEEGVYIISQLPLFLVRFSVILNTVYPGMLIGAALAKVPNSLKAALLVPVLAAILFYAGFPNTVFEGKLTDLILGGRFLVPVMPLILILFASFLHERLPARRHKTLYFAGYTFLAIISLLIHAVHQNFLFQLQLGV